MDQNQMVRRIRTLENQVQKRNQTLSALGQDPGNANVGVIKDFYIYEEDFSALASGTTATGAINIQADSDFVLQKLTYFADIAAASQTDSSRIVPLASVQITDTGSGRNLMESAAPISNVFGTGEIPFILPQPKLFLARSTITITVANFHASATYNIRLSFIGHKVFRGVTG